MRPFHLLLAAVTLLLIAEEAEAGNFRWWRCKFNRKYCKQSNPKPTETTPTPDKPTEPTPPPRDVISRIVLVPGFLGSQLRGTIKDRRHAQLAIPWEILLLLQPMENFQDHQNLSVTPYQFGKTRGVECVIEISNQCKAPSTLKNTVKFFTSKGFVRDVDIRGAPYNYRYGPDGLERLGFFNDLKKLIEEMYNGRGVTLMGHSMGGMVSLHFLNNIVDQKWKGKYIESFITLGSGLGGNVLIASAITSGVGKEVASKFGFNPEGPVAKTLSVLTAAIVRTWPGSFYNLPRPEVFKDKVIIKTKTETYTASQLGEVFKKSRIPVPPNFDSHQAAPLRNPGVATYCMYGLRGATSTEETLIYKRKKRKSKHDFEILKKISNGEGDGTVNKISLDACEDFKLTSNPKANIHNFKGAGHVGIVENKEMLEMVYEMVKKD